MHTSIAQFSSEFQLSNACRREIFFGAALYFKTAKDFKFHTNLTSCLFCRFYFTNMENYI
ncbi:hypothetical protein OBV_26780 [Oscillibacter valericigenes Sjm18-20]|nr:hypothetical protein OBV_26780 [Oscillibacter valericigenes Sjm18-20]